MNLITSSKGKLSVNPRLNLWVELKLWILQSHLVPIWFYNRWCFWAFWLESEFITLTGVPVFERMSTFISLVGKNLWMPYDPSNWFSGFREPSGLLEVENTKMEPEKWLLLHLFFPIVEDSSKSAIAYGIFLNLLLLEIL